MADTAATRLIRLHVESSQALRATNQYARAMKTAETQTANTNRALNNASRSLSGGNGISRAAGQAGYQIADLATQISMGQGAMRAFAVQGGQLVSAFGPMGAAIGGVVTVVGLLAGGFLEANEGAKVLNTSLIKGLGTLEGVRSSTSALVSIQNAYLKTVQSTPSAVNTAADAVVSATEREFQARRRIASIELQLFKLRDQDRQEALKQAQTIQAAEREIVTARAASYAPQTRQESDYPGRIRPDANAILQNAGSLENLRIANAAVAEQQIELLKAQEAARELEEALNGAAEASQGMVEIITEGPASTSSGGGGSGGGVGGFVKPFEQAKVKVDEMNASVTQLNQTFASGLADAIYDADTSFADFAASFIKQTGKMIAQQIILNSLTGAFGSGSGTLVKGLSLFEQGGAFAGGKVKPFASGGVVNSPTMFGMSYGKAGVMGEAGPEAIVPLKRGSNGDLGVQASPVNVQVINNAGGAVGIDVEEREGIVQIAVNRVKAEFARSVTSGQGTYARALETSYSGKRRFT